MQLWTHEQINNKHYYSFEGKRNLIMCSLGRYDEFKRLESELFFLKEYDVQCYSFMNNDTIIIIDCEGHACHYNILESYE